MNKPRDLSIFYCSIFFVLGFSTIFSILGVLLQTVLLHTHVAVLKWLSRIGGVMIVLFGLHVIGLIPLTFKNHQITLNKFKSSYLTSFLFGAAFAIGWTPCVGPILGSILTLAVSVPSQAFFLLLAYSLGIGIPFLFIGYFTNEATAWIKHAQKKIIGLRYVFGILLIAVGILIFSQNLGLLSNFPFLHNLLGNLQVGGDGSSLTLVIAFLAGLTSFLSPCVLPILPGFLTYIAARATKEE